ncbi:hypothetical protein [Marinisporobacter balticus]|uniref:Uncharacterized protein n=1 Tax=Marinisporobacter balticus TaxID=2018667 RepID=A0A4R2KB99_9FIRM|nr:hypothetical protein [Marinisporobacter balticus]TCO69492.1 hypothetical protein EV214_13116 [Marinisporobacter balticus]
MARENTPNISLTYETDKNNNFSYDNDIKNNMIAVDQAIKEDRDRLDNIENPDFTTVGSTTDSIISVPESSVKGQVSVGLKGKICTNLFESQNTKDSLLNIASGINIPIDLNGGISTIGSVATIVKKVNLVSGRKYLIKTDWLSPTTNNATLLRFYGGNIISDTTIIGTPTNNNLSSYLVFTAPETDLVGMAWRNNVSDSNYYHDKTFIYDITNETETNLEKLIQKYSYVNNTKSTVSTRIKSIWKNLFDKNASRISGFLAQDGNVLGSTGWFTFDFIRVKSNTSYRLSNQASSSTAHVNFYDNHKNLIGGVTNSIAVSVFDTPNNCAYIRFSTTFTTLDLVQLEEGTTATEYEPYTDSNLYIQKINPKTGEIETMNSLLNGVKDEVFVGGDGKHYLRKETEKYILQASDILTLDTSFSSNFDIIQINKKNDSNDYNNSTIQSGQTLLDGYSYGAYVDNISMIGKLFTSTTSRYGIAIQKGKYTTLADAQADKYLGGLAGLELIYQLAEPIIYENGENGFRVDGQLVSYGPGTTIQIEPFHKKVHEYKDGIKFPFAIANIEKVYRIHGEVFEPISFNDITIASDSLSITIAGEVEGENFEVYAPYKLENHGGQEIELKVPNNAAEQRDGNTRMALANSERLTRHESMILSNALDIISLELQLKQLGGN